jgi:hypothetical protein
MSSQQYVSIPASPAERSRSADRGRKILNAAGIIAILLHL